MHVKQNRSCQIAIHLLKTGIQKVLTIWRRQIVTLITCKSLKTLLLRAIRTMRKLSEHTERRSRYSNPCVEREYSPSPTPSISPVYGYVYKSTTTKNSIFKCSSPYWYKHSPVFKYTT